MNASIPSAPNGDTAQAWYPRKRHAILCCEHFSADSFARNINLSRGATTLFFASFVGAFLRADDDDHGFAFSFLQRLKLIIELISFEEQEGRD